MAADGGAASRGKSKDDLAEAGRRKLEAFRNRKKEKKRRQKHKQPANAASTNGGGAIVAEPLEVDAPALRPPLDAPKAEASSEEPQAAPARADREPVNVEPALSSAGSEGSLAASYSMLSDAYITQPKRTESPARGGMGSSASSRIAAPRSTPPATSEPAPHSPRSLRGPAYDVVTDPAALSRHFERRDPPASSTAAAPAAAANGDGGNSRDAVYAPFPVAPPSPTKSQANGRGSAMADLQDHIDTLTREKFEMRRAMESQRETIDTLTRENTSLAER